MTERKRYRIISSCLCLLVIFAFLTSLPAARPLRHKAAVKLNKHGYNALWNPGIKRLTRADNGRPYDWVWTIHIFFTRNLEGMGELDRVQIPISKTEHDQFHTFDDWNIPRSYVECYAKPKPDGTYAFEALFSKRYTGEWFAFVQRHKKGEVKLAGD